MVKTQMLNKQRNKNRILTKVVSLIMAGVFLSANTVYPDSLRPPLLCSNYEKTVKYLKTGEEEIFAKELVVFMQDKDLTVSETEGQVKYYLNNYTGKSTHWEADVDGKSPQIVAFFKDKRIVLKSDQSDILYWASAILDTLKEKPSAALHISWAYVENLNQGNNYDKTNMIMPDGKIVDASLINSLRNQAKDAGVGQNVKLEGYEFSVIEINNQKILISKDIFDIVTDGEALAILSRALSETGFKKTDNGLPLIITSLSKSPRLFEDCQKNGFIGINQAFLDLYKNNPESREYLQILLQVGLEHELRHESGKTNEFELSMTDASRLLELCGIYNVDIIGFTEFLKLNQIITEKFEKILRLTIQAERNVAELEKLYEDNPQSFMHPAEGPKEIIKYNKKDPRSFIGFGDMSKIRIMNNAFTSEILDVRIPVIAEACNKILNKYHGLAVRLGQGRGDEVGLAGPSYLYWMEMNNVRLELQYTISKFLSGYGFVKVRGVTEENKSILAGEGVYEDKDGYFLVFDKKKTGLKSLRGACDKAISGLNRELREEGFDVSLRRIGEPMDLPSPRLSFGIASPERYISNRNEDRYEAAMEYAEYIKRIAEDKGGLTGAVSELVKGLVDFQRNSSALNLLSDKEQRKIASQYNRQYLKKYNKGAIIGVDYIEDYYPVIKREYLGAVILNMRYAGPGSVFIVRGPPDNFYIAIKLKDGWAFIKTEFFYNPVGNLKDRLDKMQGDKNWLVIRDSLRFTWMGYGFKMPNELYNHSVGNEAISEAISSLKEMLENRKDFKDMNIIDFENLIDDISAKYNQNIKTISSKNFGSEVKIRTAMAIIMVAPEQKIDRRNMSTLINTGDDLIKIIKDTRRFSFKTKLGNVGNNIKDYPEDVLVDLLRKIRAKERRKFSIILRNIYSEPALGKADIDTYELLDMAKRIKNALNLLRTAMNSYSVVSSYKNIEFYLEKLDALLGFVTPFESNEVKAMFKQLSPEERIRIAYNIDMITRKELRKKQGPSLVNLGHFFEMPGFFKDPILSNFIKIPYAFTNASTIYEVEGMVGNIKGFTRLDSFIAEEDGGYVFQFLKDGKEYRILVTEDLELKLKEIRERIGIFKIPDVKGEDLEKTSLWNNSIMQGIMERAYRSGMGEEQHSLEGMLKNIIVSFVLDREDLVPVDYSDIKKEALDKIKEAVREIDALYDEGRYREIIAEADKICLENENTGKHSLKDLLESKTAGEADISQLLSETANRLGAANMKYFPISPVRAGDMMRKLYVILKAIQILSENKEFEEKYGLDTILEAVVTRDDL